MDNTVIKHMTFAPTLDLYNKARSLSFPMFPIQVDITDRDGKVVATKKILEPHLMQRIIVSKLLENRCFANWSDMGTGKTLAAVMCAHAVNAKLTIIICPNSVKEEWESHIKAMFSDCIIINSIKDAKPKRGRRVFVVVNYEQFQQSWSKEATDRLTTQKVDFLVLDEIHLVKQRDENLSERRAILLDMRANLEKKNPKLYVLGQTGTPCINDSLREPISLLSLISGELYDDIPTIMSIPNVFRVRQAMILNGIRCPSSQKENAPQITHINCNHRLDDILEARSSLLQLDRILLQEKLPYILANLKKGEKTIIYLHLIDKLTDMLQVALRQAGYIVDVYTGIESAITRSSVKRDFIHGNTDVLIASSPINTGVDGLQKVCRKMIIPILPWTAAEYKQLKARIERFGQLSPTVDILIPLAFIEHEGDRWSLDETRWNRILFKQSLGDVLTDGDIPPEAMLSLERVKKACIKWLNRIEAGRIHDRERPKIAVEFEGERLPTNHNFAELHQMNARFNRMHSKKAAGLLQDRQLFEKYHDLYAQESFNWTVHPREIIASWCVDPEEVIGDFGCGDVAHLADLLPNNEVHSFDHNSRDDDRIFCCDIADVPLEDGQLDVAIFSLSLMGCNYKEYLQEAHRCLRPGGKIYIADLTEHKLVQTLKADLEAIGFTVTEQFRRWKFSFLKGSKNV